MKKKLALYMLFAILFIASCSKSEKEHDNDQNVTQSGKINLTSEQIHSLDSIAAKIITENPGENRLKSGLVVTTTANKLSCNNFNLMVTINQQFCPKSVGSTIVAYFTLFDGSKILNLSPVYGNPCIQGTEVKMNYTATRTTYLYFVMLLIDPKTNLVQGYFISNTVILKPDC